MKHALLFLVGLLFSSFCQGTIDERYLDPSLPIDKRVRILMRQMTLEEKVPVRRITIRTQRQTDCI